MKYAEWQCMRGVRRSRICRQEGRVPRHFARAYEQRRPVRAQCALCRAAFLFGMPLPTPGACREPDAGELPCLFCGTPVPELVRRGRWHGLAAGRRRLSSLSP